MMFLKIKIEESEILSIDMSGQPTRLQLLCFFFMKISGLNTKILFTVWKEDGIKAQLLLMAVH